MNQPPDNHPLRAGIHAKLTEIVTTSSAPLPWQEAWSRLEPQSSDGDKLAVYKAVRDAGSVPPEAGFFLVAWMLDMLTDERAEEGLRDTEAHLDDVRQKYGLGEDAPADTDDAPAEYREAMQRSHDAWDALYVATLQEHCEHDMARLFREDHQHFVELYETGRQFFHGPLDDEDDLGDDELDEDDWLDMLHDAVSACVEADSPMGPLGLRYWEADGVYEVWMYPTPVELMGGRHDGEVVVPGFSLDLDGLREAFESVAAFGWNALGLHHTEGPHVYVEGVFAGREVYLQVLAYAPEGEEPGLKLDASRQHRPRE